MLFSKLKPKEDDLLPPPPPFPSLEPEEEKEKPKLFDEIIKPVAKTEISPDVKEFNELVKEMDKGIKTKKAISKKGKISLKKIAAIKKQKTPKKIELKQLKKARLKEKKAPIRKLKTEAAKKTFELPELEEDLELKEPGFELPKELEEEESETGLPETLEEFEGVEGIGIEEESKPKEISEAEEEIKDAIEKIKKQEKPSFFRRLFAKKKKLEEKPEEHLFSEAPGIDEVSIIQNNINKARDALMKFDLETAKKSYIEIINLYNKIKPEEQAKVYNEIKDLYFERKSAEGLKA